LAKGHRFASASDTEVIVHLYEDFGAEAVNHLDGMFAMAIHERDTDRVFSRETAWASSPCTTQKRPMASVLWALLMFHLWADNYAH
jgi:hypothetical protein